jgi:4-(cytidine 5'-diphospho)-2-C-methyl-D-erythritol kinase
MVLFPNAKINIGLFVTEKRPDGFHNLETVFYPIDLHDILEIHAVADSRGDCSFTATGIAIDCAPEKNLVTRAYHLLAGEHDLPSVDVHLHKVIPYGAGLGGGSADAAFMLVGLNRLFSLGLSEGQLMAYAAQLGSDCAFFVRNRPVFAFGKGELMEPVDLSLSAYSMVLVKPDRGVSTPEAYRGIVPRPAPFDLREIGKLPVSAWESVVKNDFEASVIPRVPEIGEIKDKLRSLGALYVAMTGSGSAVYALFKNPVDVREYFPGCFVWNN